MQKTMFKNLHLMRIQCEYWKPIKTSVRFQYSMSYMNMIRNSPQIRCSKLSNGLIVATDERNSPNTCIGFYVNAGARYETIEENGITHFFEHIAFKSTKARPKTVLENEILKSGAKFQCFTTREMAVYFVQCLSSEVPVVFNILLDCIFNNKLEHAAIETERKVVCWEMFEHEKNYTKILFDYLHTSAFQGTSLEQTVMGSYDNIFTFNSRMLADILYKRFTPNNMVLTAIGGVKHKDIVEMSNKCLKKLMPVELEETRECRYTGSDMRYRDDSQPMAHVAIAMEGPSYRHEDYSIMKLATEVVGGWDKSRLGGLGHGTSVVRAASHDNICEAYKSFYIAYKDTALWGAYFVAPRLSLDDMTFALQEEWMNLCNTITDEQLERAKVQLKTKYLSSTQSAVQTSHLVGRSFLYRGCYLSLFDRIGIIDKITVKHVKDVCYKYLYDKCPVVAAIGPTESLSDYARIRSSTYWLRI